ncbi:hypothetical protein [Capybara microvirus Cap1_SP_119]|nr:hypothetical protein [Capybara microvirus Cap1_SP_119]
MKIRNKSTFYSDYSKTHFDIDTDIFVRSCSSVYSYSVRNYYEYKSVIDSGGQCFFYTLTHNDSSIVRLYGRSFPNYEGLRNLVNGAFKKRIEKLTNCRFTYFAVTEFGEGKGYRGLDNNPHYHILFYLHPCTEKGSYVPISSNDFCELVRYYWQGDKYHYKDSLHILEPKDYIYGIASPSNINNGEVTNFSAIRYCCKYITKDSYYQVFRKNLLKDIYYSIVKQLTLCDDIDIQTDPNYVTSRLISFCGSLNTAFDFINEQQKKIYCSLYSYIHLVHCSKKLGSLGLEYIDYDNNSLTIPFPDSKGSLRQCSLPLYYYRKVCYDITKNYRGNVHYYLNDYGIKCKSNLFPKDLKKQFDICKSTISSYFDDDLLTDYNNLHINSSFTYQDIKDLYHNDELLNAYVLFNFVYRERFYDRRHISICPEFDYEHFLVPSLVETPFTHIEPNLSKYESYENNPYFKPYMPKFSLLDELFTFFKKTAQEYKIKEYERRKYLKRVHSTQNI